MDIKLPPPLEQAPAPRPALQDFKLLLKIQLRVTYNKLRHWPPVAWIGIVLAGVFAAALIIFLANLTYGALESMPPQIAGSFLSLLFMAGLAALIFFGITAAFATLYMADDLELLFMAPVSTRVVFAAKSVIVAVGNLLPVGLFIILPGLFFGLLFKTGAAYYLWVVLIALGLLAIGTALAELLNLVVMRIIPPHRSKEAIGVIGAVAGIMIALLFQVPGIILSSNHNLDLTGWLAGQEQALQALNYFPFGWGAKALVESAAGNHLAALGWSALLLGLGAVIFALSFMLVERGFRRGWVSISQGAGGRKGKKRRTLATAGKISQEAASLPLYSEKISEPTSPWQGMWSVAKKDLLYVRRDTREWFGYSVPLIIMMFFVAQFLFFPVQGGPAPMIMILVIYTIMFSGNMALQSFGREGESEWVLNSVPLAGWPVIWGKLLGAVLPTLVLMQALLVGTAVAIKLEPKLILGLAVGAVFVTLGSSAIGLFFSINNCRYNPDSPQQRISPGASLFMYLLNILFVGLMALGLLYVFPPEMLVNLLQELPPPEFQWGVIEVLLYIIYLLSRPLLWDTVFRVMTGVTLTTAIWGAVFFGFMAATVRQSRKGFRVEIVTTSKQMKKMKKL